MRNALAHVSRGQHTVVAAFAIVLGPMADHWLAFEQNDARQTASRYMMLEAFAQIDNEETDPIQSIKAT
ncbi:MAG: hypothetical protein AAF943_08715 [Pseudomonadota bacterium]